MSPAVLNALHAFGGVFVIAALKAALAIALLVVVAYRVVRP